MTVLAVPAGAACASGSPEPTAQTRSGAVRGVRDDAVTRFRGIPHAAPPVGDRRWRPPHEPASWDGVRPATPACAYEFADEHAQPFVDLPPDFPAGASHASELPDLFEVAGRQPITSDRYTGAQRRLAGQMIGYWTAFARTGDPNHAGAPVWPRAVAGRPTTLRLAPDGIAPIDSAAVHRCGFWRRHSR